jgi:hypothetical protein
MNDSDSAQATPHRRRLGVPWRRDAIILQRLPEVERRHLQGQSNYTIAAALGVDEGTIRADLRHLQEIWLERIQDEQESLRGACVASLVDLRRRAIEAAEFDQRAVLSVLFGEPFVTDDGRSLRAHRDDHDKAEYRANISANLNTARQATMDIAKLLGLTLDVDDHRGETLVRIYERVTEFVTPDASR